jgi:hypothetical protein
MTARSISELPSNPELPDPWHVVANYPGGTRRSISIFPTKEDALQKYTVGLQPWADDPVFTIERDTPELSIECDGFDLVDCARIKARANWFQRYQDVLRPILPPPQKAAIVVYSMQATKESRHRIISGTLDRAPKCGTCGKQFRWLSCLDFRGQPVQCAVPERCAALVLL